MFGYRRYDTIDLRDMESDEISNSTEDYVLEKDVTNLIDDIESDVNEIKDLLKDYELKEAIEKIEELSQKLY